MLGAMSHDNSRTDAFLLVAVGNTVLHSEAVHAAAATTRPIIDITDPADLPRYLPRAAAVLVDAEFASPDVEHPHLFFVGPDNHPMDWNAALSCRASAAFTLPSQSAELLAALSEVPAAPATHRPSPSSSGMVLGVVGVVGGSGASTLAAALAKTASGAVSLIDGDPYSGGLDLLLGIEETPGLRWPDLAMSSAGQVLGDDLRTAVPRTADGVAVLSAARSTIDDPFSLPYSQVDRAAQAMGQVGAVVVDLPRDAIDDVRCDQLCVVVPREVRSTAAATKLLARLRAAGKRYVVVTRARSWAGLSLGDVERVLHDSVLADIPQVPGLPKTIETQGLTRLPRSLKAAAEEIWAEVAA